MNSSSPLVALLVLIALTTACAQTPSLWLKFNQSTITDIENPSNVITPVLVNFLPQAAPFPTNEQYIMMSDSGSYLQISPAFVLNSTNTYSFWMKGPLTNSGSEIVFDLNAEDNVTTAFIDGNTTYAVGKKFYPFTDFDFIKYFATRNDWTHVAFVSNGAVTALYLNGTLKSSALTAVSFPMVYMLVGLTSAGIYDVQVFNNQALTPNQLVTVANTDCPGCVAPLSDAAKCTTCPCIQNNNPKACHARVANGGCPSGNHVDSSVCPLLAGAVIACPCTNQSYPCRQNNNYVSCYPLVNGACAHGTTQCLFPVAVAQVSTVGAAEGASSESSSTIIVAIVVGASVLSTAMAVVVVKIVKARRNRAAAANAQAQSQVELNVQTQPQAEGCDAMSIKEIQSTYAETEI